MSVRISMMLVRFAAPVALFAFAGPSDAAPCNGNLKVATTAVAFGTYTAPSTSTANGTITVSCPGTAGTLPSYTISLSTGGAASFTPRQMNAGAPTLQYNLFTTASFTSVWGDGTGSTVTKSGGNGSLNSENHTVFGRIPSGQYVTPGAYTDTITATVTF